MLLIYMLETKQGTDDGHIVRRYKAENIYEVREHLACHLINNGHAVRCDAAGNWLHKPAHPYRMRQLRKACDELGAPEFHEFCEAEGFTASQIMLALGAAAAQDFSEWKYFNQK